MSASGTHGYKKAQHIGIINLLTTNLPSTLRLLTSKGKMASSTSTISFNEIASSHDSLRNASGTGRRVNDAKLTQIILKARDVQWNPRQMTTETVPSDPSYGQRETSHRTQETMRDRAQVNIVKGLCKGLNTKVKLPFPFLPGDSQGHRVLDVDPCDPSQSNTIETPIELTSEARGRYGASVEEVMKRHVYRGEFSCKVYPGGSILLETTGNQAVSHGQIKTQQVIGTLKDRGHPSVKDFEEDGNGFYFMMRGNCNLAQDAQLQHTWS